MLEYLTASRRGRRLADKDEEVKSPPTQRRRVDSSPGGDLAPMPSSPPSAAVNPQSEAALFSSPVQPRSLSMLIAYYTTIQLESDDPVQIPLLFLSIHVNFNVL